MSRTDDILKFNQDIEPMANSILKIAIDARKDERIKTIAEFVKRLEAKLHEYKEGPDVIEDYEIQEVADEMLKEDGANGELK